MNRRPLLLGCCLLLCLSTARPAEKLGGHWPGWRGLHRDGLSTDRGLLPDWNAKSPVALWHAPGVGKGFASIALADDRIFTTGDRGADQYLIALRADDGTKLWERRIGPAGGIGYAGSRCTPTVDGERVYAIGSRGDVACLRVSDGRPVWRRHLARDFGGRMMSGWGYSESPLVDGDKLLCTPGGDGAGIVALDKLTGREVWRADLGPWDDNGAGYASIVISQARGVQQYVQLTGRGVVGVAAQDGRLLWGYRRIANGTANIPTPIVRDDYVFCSTGYGAGAALLRVVGDGNRLHVEEVYFLPGRTFQNHHGGMLLVGDHVYCGAGHNNGFPICVELETGRVTWFAGRGPGTGSAAITYADGNLYFRYQNGVMALIEATPAAYRMKGTFRIPGVRDPSWAHPVVTGGRLYLREQDRLHCYDVRARP